MLTGGTLEGANLYKNTEGFQPSHMLTFQHHQTLERWQSELYFSDFEWVMVGTAGFEPTTSTV
jgi:hypothetical protein